MICSLLVLGALWVVGCERPVSENGAYVEQRFVGLMRLVYEAEVEGDPENQRRIGYEREWNAKGQLVAERHYAHGQLNGIERIWFENGVLNVEQTYRDGVLEGPYTRWYDDGKIATRGAMCGGRECGVWEMWYNTGEYLAKVTRDNGMNNGPTQRWNHMGFLEVDGQYVAGEREGEWRYFDAAGNLTRIEVWEHGKLRDDP
ncbi:MAG: toxin-antitoxin system YwqK family antitoxin [Phycisphaerales bacterium]|nr:toxin-antitoxin system YwqK family antitoxin [Phycisphaerales bacterium]